MSTVVSLLEQHTRRYLSHTGNWLFGSVQPNPALMTVALTVTIGMDGNSCLQFNGLPFSLELEVGQRDQIVTCDPADSPLTSNSASPNGRSAQSF